ncbi:hypothetical protein BKG58_19700 [Mycobacteroides abscessus subsp. abscessus]|uniref:hypothetical protein n=1 Tax=Mycobacteroides abscessus TaxID=36809 RepID=UPI0003453C64|nr:hypothetical protein [Mycobacteroides abscessus]OLT79656.1 hypothetical protein BKG58_19700 [Mycobacteroides abscessus subsp. abscessus]SHP93707.1 Uncharacterised protein [Mycobacteroides abscessus subsp. abscessus]SKO06281.1 Uncharacterised protein [Mycobacteroides abscessus subsp. abscessus]
MGTEPTIWTRIVAAPGWQRLYRQLRRDVAALDPAAQITSRIGTGMLHLHVDQAEPTVVQQVRDLCFDAEGASMRTCQVCGGAGQPRRLGETEEISTLCGRHAAMAGAVLDPEGKEGT